MVVVVPNLSVELYRNNVSSFQLQHCAVGRSVLNILARGGTVGGRDDGIAVLLKSHYHDTIVHLMAGKSEVIRSSHWCGGVTYDTHGKERSRPIAVKNETGLEEHNRTTCVRVVVVSDVGEDMFVDERHVLLAACVAFAGRQKGTRKSHFPH